MVPPLTAMQRTPAQAPLRFGAVYVPNGVIPGQWFPSTDGKAFEFSPSLKPLEKFREQLLVVSGLDSVPPPPPGMEAFDEALEPQVTIVKAEKETREEYRVKGKLYMVKVTPAIGPSYYLVDRLGDGNFIEADIGKNPVKPPMWILHSW
jgi:hypothetical protein